MSSVSLNPERVFRLLEQEGAEVVLIGGLAAVAQGVPIIHANDIDLCYNPDPTNLPRLVRALAPLHPRLRLARLGDEEARPLPFRWDERTLTQSPVVTLQTDAGALDLMSTVQGVGSYAAVLAVTKRVDLYRTHVLALDLPALIASKRAAGRPKDLMALPQIEATLRLRDLGQHGPTGGKDSPDVPHSGGSARW
jgi:hypothetical protein